MNRIYRLLGESQYSIHDLSRVQGSTRRREARFNMPFELGLAYSLRKEKRTHQFLIFEEVRYRLTRTLSDLNGFDPQIHDGEPMKMLRLLRGSFVSRHRPSIEDLRAVYRASRSAVRAAARLEGLSVFDADGFRFLSAAASQEAAERGLIPER
ncbi:hypothetical protein [Vulgatibacter sp.]|uniref:hypothetical protein n=1 Tax=Vulgatibacter sp. TaxID=1971226 RepID=UPI0035638A2D